MGGTFITLDVGNTLGRFTGPSVEDRLADLAQQYHPKARRGDANPWRDMAAEVNRWFLHVAPKLTDEVKAAVCAYLLLPLDAWPTEWDAGFEPYLDALETLNFLRHFGELAAVSNISVVTGPHKVGDLHRRLGHFLDGVHTSYELGTRKPHPDVWKLVAAYHHVQVSDIVHVGDRAVEDVHGPLNAGCRAAIFVNTRNVPVPDEFWSDKRVSVVNRLRDVPVALQQTMQRA